MWGGSNPGLHTPPPSVCMASMRVLFVENEDSFSWNVIDALPVGRPEISVVSGADRSAVTRALDDCSLLVIGPGPTDPARAGLLELVRTAAERRLPTLGICLGHQAIGLAFGAALVPVTPCHGKQSTVFIRESRLIPTFREPLIAMRYHSLALRDVKAPLRIVAETEDGIVMGVEHTSLPMAGLQFHPDSFGTPRGRELLAGCFEALA